jgi:hypothetical protein
MVEEECLRTRSGRAMVKAGHMAFVEAEKGAYDIAFLYRWGQAFRIQ